MTRLGQFTPLASKMQTWWHAISRARPFGWNLKTAKLDDDTYRYWDCRVLCFKMCSVYVYIYIYIIFVFSRLLISLQQAHDSSEGQDQVKTIELKQRLLGRNIGFHYGPSLNYNPFIREVALFWYWCYNSKPFAGKVIKQTGSLKLYH